MEEESRLNKDLPDELGPYDGDPPDEVHFGFRPDTFPLHAKTRFRWWKSRGWNGQFDVFDRPALLKHIEESELPVFDYDARVWE